MSFKIGDAVVYPHHGVAVIEGRQPRTAFGQNRDYRVLKVAHGDLTLLVPVECAELVGLRETIGAEEAQEVLATLAKRDTHVPLNWSRRFKNHMTKLQSGDIYQVAEVVRNLTRHDRQRPLSAGEKRMLVTPLRLLLTDLTVAMPLSPNPAVHSVNGVLPS